MIIWVLECVKDQSQELYRNFKVVSQ